MSVLIDTSVWSLGLRRKRRDLNPVELRAYFEWESLINRGEAAIIGPIRQEVLSGVSGSARFAQLRLRLAVIDDLFLPSDSYILAAEFFNTCRAGRVAPSGVDMLICAAAHTHSVSIFSTDPDFGYYARHLPIDMHTSY